MSDKTGAARGGELKLLGVGLLFAVFYLAARIVLTATTLPLWVRLSAALVPVPVFVILVLAFYRAIGCLDEFQRLIQLKALAFAFPASWVLVLTLGLLEKAIRLPPEDLSYRHVWAMMPIFYFLGLWLAQRRYR
jgi:hypothetical protein